MQQPKPRKEAFSGCGCEAGDVARAPTIHEGFVVFTCARGGGRVGDPRERSLVCPQAAAARRRRRRRRRIRFGCWWLDERGIEGREACRKRTTRGWRNIWRERSG